MTGAPPGYTVTISDEWAWDEFGITASVRRPDGRYIDCDFYGRYCNGWHRTVSGAMRCGIKQARHDAREERARKGAKA